MAKDYSEDQLIQKSTAELLEKELGWKAKRDIKDACRDAYYFQQKNPNGIE